MGISPGIQEHDKINVARAISVGTVSPAGGAAMLATMDSKKLLNKPQPHKKKHHSLADFGHLLHDVAKHKVEAVKARHEIEKR